MKKLSALLHDLQQGALSRRAALPPSPQSSPPRGELKIYDLLCILRELCGPLRQRLGEAPLAALCVKAFDLLLDSPLKPRGEITRLIAVSHSLPQGFKGFLPRNPVEQSASGCTVVKEWGLAVCRTLCP